MYSFHLYKSPLQTKRYLDCHISEGIHWKCPEQNQKNLVDLLVLLPCLTVLIDGWGDYSSNV